MAPVWLRQGCCMLRMEEPGYHGRISMSAGQAGPFRRKQRRAKSRCISDTTAEGYETDVETRLEYIQGSSRTYPSKGLAGEERARRMLQEECTSKKAGKVLRK